MINSLFSHNQFYVQFRAPNADELSSYVLNKPENFTQFEWASECKVNTIDCPWEETQPLIIPSLKKFGELLGTDFECNFENPWINCYESGGYQEIHDHLGVDFASVFFPERENNFGEFYFHDRYSNSLNPKWKEIFNFSTVWIPDISPGDIIFFPSSVFHGVKTHQSEKTRKTLSCNYTFAKSMSTENRSKSEKELAAELKRSDDAKGYDTYSK